MKIKRVVSWILSMIMILTLVPSTVFADETQSPTLTKTAEWIHQEEGLAKITMKAAGTPIDVTAKTGADVLLVMDASGSMNDVVDLGTYKEKCGATLKEKTSWLVGVKGYSCPQCKTTYATNSALADKKCTNMITKENKKTRWQIAKEAADTLVADIIPDAQSNNNMGVILFSSDGYNNHKQKQVFTKNKSSIQAKYNSFTPAGGTNYTEALDEAYKMINNRTDTSRPAYVIFLTDGAPGLYGDSIHDTDWNGTEQIAELKSNTDANDVTIYTVGFALTDTGAINLLKGYATKSSYFQNITDGNALAGLLADIGKTIASGVTIWDTVDTEYFDVVSYNGKKYTASNGSDKVQFSDNKNFVWNFDNFSLNGDTLEIYIQLKANYRNTDKEYPTNQSGSAYGKYVGSDGKKVDLPVSETTVSSAVPKLPVQSKPIPVSFEFVGETTKAKFNAPAEQNQQVKINTKVVQPSVTIDLGYKMTDWYTNKDCTGKSFEFDQQITSMTPFKLYAKVEKDDNATYAYTVKFYKNDILSETKEGSVWVGEAAVTLGNLKNLKTKNYTKYDFVHAKSGTKEYTKDDSSIPVIAGAEISLYYTAKKVNLTFQVGEHGKFNESNKSEVTKTSHFDAEFSDVPEVTANLGWQAEGWYELGDKDQKIVSFSQKVTGDKTYVMKYSKKNDDWKKVTFHKNDGSTTEGIVIDNILKGSQISSEQWPKAPNRENYEFKGWFTKNGENNEWGTEFTKDIKVDEDFHVYAKWVKVTTDVAIAYYLGSVKEDTKLEFSEIQKISDLPIGNRYLGYITDALKDKGNDANNLGVNKHYYSVSKEDAVIYINEQLLKENQTIKAEDVIQVVYPAKLGTFKVWEYFPENDEKNSYGGYLSQYETKLPHGSSLKYGKENKELTLTEINNILKDSLRKNQKQYPGIQLKSVYIDYQKFDTDGKCVWQSSVSSKLNKDHTKVESFDGLNAVKIHGDCETRLTFNYELPVYDVEYYVYEKKNSSDKEITARFDSGVEAKAAVQAHIPHDTPLYSGALSVTKSQVSYIDLNKFPQSTSPDKKDRTETESAKFVDFIKNYQNTESLNTAYNKASGYDVVPFRLVQEGNIVHVDCYLVKNPMKWTTVTFKAGEYGKWADESTADVVISALKGGKVSDYSSQIPVKPIPNEIGWKLKDETQVWDNAFNPDTTIPDTGLVYTALWMEDTAEITFQVKGIEINDKEELFGVVSPKKQFIQKGKTAQDPTEEAIKDIQKGYQLDGWYTDEKCTQKFNFETPLIADTTLFAKMVRNEADWTTVTFKAGDGGKLNENATEVITDPILIGSKLGRVIPTKNPNTGFEFAGWYKVTAGDEKTLETPTEDTEVTMGLEYLAKFSTLHKVFFHVDTTKAVYGIGKLYPETNIKNNTPWGEIKVPEIKGNAQDASRKEQYSHDYDFIGWNNHFPEAVTSDLNFTAQFEDVYTLLVEHTDLNEGGSYPHKSKEYFKNKKGESIQSEANSPIRGYELSNITVFKGKDQITVESLEELIQKLQEEYGITLTTDGTLSGKMPSTLLWVKYGYEKLAEHSVEYVSEGTVTNMPETIKDRYKGDEIIISDAVPQRDGYDFVGWEVVENVVTVNDGKFVMPDSNVQIKANWTPNEEVWKYTVKHYLEGSETPFSSDEGSVLKREPNITAIVVKAPEGYHFKEYQINGDRTELPITIDEDGNVISVIYEKNDLVVRHKYGSTTVYDSTQSKADMKGGKVVVDAVNSGRYTRVVAIWVDGVAVNVARSVTVDFDTSSKHEVLFEYRIPSSSGGGGSDSDSGSNKGGGNFGEEVTILDEEVALADGLNMVDHFTYIFGYEDGNVRPMNKITREEVAAIFYRLLNDDFRDNIKTTNHLFPDVAAERWSNKNIATLANGTIIAGYPSGKFEPGKFITRAEFSVIVSKFDRLSKTETNLFKDIEHHWAKNYINSAALKGWIHGYPDNTFHPDEYITRAEAVTLINSVLNRQVSKEGLLENAKYWPDNTTDAWYYEAMMEATNSHDYTRETMNAPETWTQIVSDKVWD